MLLMEWVPDKNRELSNVLVPRHAFDCPAPFKRKGVAKACIHGEQAQKYQLSDAVWHVPM